MKIYEFDAVIKKQDPIDASERNIASIIQEYKE